MAYRSYLKYYGAGNQATVMTDTSTYLQAMGWTLEKTVSASRHFLSTVGEDGTHQKFWLDLQVSGNYLYFLFYAFINTTTDTGYGGAYTNTNATYYRIDCSAAGYIKFYGSKDLVYFEYGASSVVAPTTANCKLFGVIPYDLVVPKPYAITANAETAGAGVTIEVDDTDGFQRGDYYQIFDPSTGCRERIQITAISAGASVTATIANNYAAGSIIAYLPHSGFSSSGGSTFEYLYPVCPIGVRGTGNASQANGYWRSQYPLLYIGGATADYRNNLYSLSQRGFMGQGGSEIASAARVAVGYVTDDFLYHGGLSVADTMGTVDAGNLFRNGTATGGGAATMDDAGASWTVDAEIGKILILTGGTGAGQTRWITDNTATQLTVGQNWVTQPVAGTTYMIVDDVYRNLGSTFDYFWLRETIGEP